MAEETQPAKPVFSGKTQIVVASIGAIGTISGALIAANWGRGREPVAVPTTVATQPANNLDITRTGGTLVFPGSRTTGTAAVPGPPPPPPNLALFGEWRMPDGTTTTISQNDDGLVDVNSQLQIGNEAAVYAGRGQAAGDYVQWQYRGNDGDAGQCIVQMTPDTQHLGGYCQHANGTTNQIVFVRSS